MGLKGFYKKHENFILAAALTGILILFTSFRYDFYYDLNDDVLMKDILAGVYTGTPESRNIQMLYPLSLLLSLFYRLFPAAPVYGLFLCLCQFGSFFLIVKRSLRFRKSTGSRLFMVLFEGIIITGLFLSHLVFIQYTVSAALLASTAAYLFLTTDRGLPAGTFIRRNLLSAFLAVAAFLMRSEMLLLLLPLICVTGILRWSEEKHVFTKDNVIKYFTVFGVICAGLLTGQLIHTAAYGEEDWKTFCEFFDSRTELYDFQGIPPYEGNEALYQGLGIGRNEQRLLLERYDFGMDERVDAAMLDAISAYQEKKNAQERPFSRRLKESLAGYFYRTLHREAPAGSEDTDYPFNLMVILGYIAVFLTGIWHAVENGDRVSAGVLLTGWKLALLGCVRTALWLFLLMRNRYPVRITHSLYLMEVCILFGMLLTEYAGVEERLTGRIKAAVIFPLIMCFTALLTVPGSILQTDRAYEARNAAAVTDLSVRAYCLARPDSFYFRDVYGTVSETLPSGYTAPYSEKLFVGVENGAANYDIMGGWLVKSPLTAKKLERFGIKNMSEALIYGENIYLMAEIGAGTDWLTGYYEDRGIQVSVERKATVNDRIGVYRLSASEGRTP